MCLAWLGQRWLSIFEIFHTSWSALPPCPAAPSLPAAVVGPSFGGETLLVETVSGNETMCTHRDTVCTTSPNNPASPCGEQSPQCLPVAQLDTAVEPRCSSRSPRTELCGGARSCSFSPRTELCGGARSCSFSPRREHRFGARATAATASVQHVCLPAPRAFQDINHCLLLITTHAFRKTRNYSKAVCCSLLPQREDRELLIMVQPQQPELDLLHRLICNSLTNTLLQMYPSPLPQTLLYTQQHQKDWITAFLAAAFKCCHMAISYCRFPHVINTRPLHPFGVCVQHPGVKVCWCGQHYSTEHAVTSSLHQGFILYTR